MSIKHLKPRTEEEILESLLSLKLQELIELQSCYADTDNKKMRIKIGNRVTKVWQAMSAETKSWDNQIKVKRYK